MGGKTALTDTYRQIEGTVSCSKGWRHEGKETDGWTNKCMSQTIHFCRALWAEA